MKRESTGRRVLVIEDEMMVAMGLEMALEDAGYDVVGPFGRLDQALDAACNERMDVALLDVNVRGEDIFPVADILAARGIPYVFLTGYGRDILPARFGSGRILSKPFQAIQLVAAVRELTA
ncbi:response regulator [Magnetospirillum sp. UT-4]|uniref:response regulator n=1 Tax=Magnetospirillum sp. UT-4 TaxID=2681467 RepID=UPI0013843E61|nr:response regulator [Magnetospirillum sp. UT-4]CAA7614938.1 putative two-component response regulator protein [Magnetospirillum sp. UT-4]